jgi:hypothetical protein
MAAGTADLLPTVLEAIDTQEHDGFSRTVSFPLHAVVHEETLRSDAASIRMGSRAFDEAVHLERRAMTRDSDSQYRGARNTPAAQIVERAVGVSKRVTGRGDIDVTRVGNFHEGLAIGPREVRHRLDSPLAPKVGVWK